MRISEVARQAGVNVQTLRYYERRGLLAEPDRVGAGYRRYDRDAVRTVRFVKRAQSLGFSLDEISSLLSLASGQPADCNAARAMATGQLAELDAKIASLVAMRDSIRRLIATCDASGGRECPLIEAMEGLIHDA